MKTMTTTVAALAVLVAASACAADTTAPSPSPSLSPEPTVTAPIDTDPEMSPTPGLDINVSELNVSFTSANGYYFASPPERWEEDILPADLGFADQALWIAPGGEDRDYALAFAWTPDIRATVIGDSPLSAVEIATMLGEGAADYVVVEGYEAGYGDGNVSVGEAYAITAATGETGYLVPFFVYFESGVEAYAPFVFFDVYGGAYSAAGTNYDMAANPDYLAEFDAFVESLAFWPAW